MSNTEITATPASRRGPAATWAAALLIAWLPTQGLCAPNESGSATPTRPLETITEKSGPAASYVGNPEADANVDVGGKGVEVTLAAHGNIVVVGWVDRPLRCGWSVSHDGGKTWGAKFITPPTSGDITGDPSVSVDAQGNFYLVCQDYGVSQVRLSKSTDGAKTWTPWKNIQSTPDKPWVAGVRNGTVYLTWLGWPGGFKRSLDGGETWDAVKPLGDFTSGTTIGAGNTGLVHILYTLGSGLRYVRSKDWGATVDAGRHIIPSMGSSCVGCTPRQFPIVGGGSDPTGKYVVAAWSARTGASDATDNVNVTISRDGGDTWTPAIQVNDNTTSRQFLPWAAADASGKVHVIWTDWRNSKNSIYYSYIGSDNKPSKNVELTDKAGSTSSASFFGDYHGVVVNGNDVLVTWVDTRSGGNSIYFSRGVGLASGGVVAVRDRDVEAARIKASWTTTAIYDLKGARVKDAGGTPARGKYLPGKAPAR